MRSKALRAAGPYFLGFVLAVGVMVVSTMWSGIYPFGDRSFLTEDLMYQYVDFFTWFQHVLFGSESLFYSTSQALGNNAWGLYGYYLGSPLNLLIGLFPEGAITEFVYFVTALKIGGIQVCTMFFLRRRFGLSWAWCTVLALGFTWSTWTASQLRNPEWLDVLALLPLAAWGAHELLHERHWRLLVVSVALAVVCCWYTAYMLIVFLCLYFLFELWLARRGFAVGCDAVAEGSQGHAPKPGIRAVGRFAAAIAVALALAAFTFIPSVLAMTRQVSPELDIAEHAGGLFARGLSRLAPYPSVVIAGCIAAAVFAIVLCFVVRTKRLTPRAKYGTVLILTVLLTLAVVGGSIFAHLTSCDISSFLQGFLPGGWRLGDVPQLYAGLVPLLLLIGFFFAPKIPLGVKTGGAVFLCVMAASIFCFPLYVMWCGFKTPNGFYCRTAFLMLFLMVWLGACFLASQSANFERIRPRVKHIVGIVLVVFATCDAGLSVHAVWEQLYRGYSQSYHEEYVAQAKAEHDRLTEADPTIYRIAKTSTRAGMAALNEGMAIGYDEISSYSSAYDVNAVAFLNAMGYSRVGEFSTRYASPLLMMDSLLGVKYVYSTVAAEGFDEVQSAPDSIGPSGARLYENPYALALGYLVSPGACDVSLAGTTDPFQRQNLLLDALVGESIDPYVPCEATETDVSASLKRYEVRIPAGCLGYAFVVGAGNSPCYLVSDKGVFMENARFQDAVYGIAAESDAPQTVTVDLSATSSGSAAAGSQLPPNAQCVFYALDMEKFSAACETLAEGQLSLDAFSGRGIRGTVEVEGAERALLMVSVPYSDGWTAHVNGAKVEQVPIAGGALTGIPVGAGSNCIEMDFVPPGLLAGSLISVVAVLAISIFMARARFFGHRVKERKGSQS